jgi:hypothetical protein
LESKLKEYSLLSAEIGRLVMQAIPSEENLSGSLADKQSEKQKIEEYLVSSIPEMKLEKNFSIDIRCISEKLPTNAILIDFVKCDDFFNWRNNSSSTYIAFVLDKSDNLHMVDLDDANMIDDLIVKFRTSLNRGETDTFRSYGAKIRRALLDPLSKIIENHRQLLIAPYTL